MMDNLAEIQARLQAHEVRHLLDERLEPCVQATKEVEEQERRESMAAAHDLRTRVLGAWSLWRTATASSRCLNTSLTAMSRASVASIERLFDALPRLGTRQLCCCGPFHRLVVAGSRILRHKAHIKNTMMCHAERSHERRTSCKLLCSSDARARSLWHGLSTPVPQSAAGVCCELPPRATGAGSLRRPSQPGVTDAAPGGGFKRSFSCRSRAARQPCRAQRLQVWHTCKPPASSHAGYVVDAGRPHIYS